MLRTKRQGDWLGTGAFRHWNIHSWARLREMAFSRHRQRENFDRKNGMFGKALKKPHPCKKRKDHPTSRAKSTSKAKKPNFKGKEG